MIASFVREESCRYHWEYRGVLAFKGHFWLWDGMGWMGYFETMQELLLIVL